MSSTWLSWRIFDCAFSGSRLCILSEVSGKQQVFSVLDSMRGRLQKIAEIETTGDFSCWSLSPEAGRIAVIDNNSDSVRVLDLTSK